MKEQLIIKTKPKNRYYIGGFFVGVLCETLVYLAIKQQFEERYPHYFPILVISGFCALGLWSIIKILNTDILFLYPNRLVIKSILGYHRKTIERKNIIECYERARSIRYHETHPNYEYNELFIYTDKIKYKIRSDYYTGYPLIKKILITDPNPRQRKTDNNNKGCFSYIRIGSYIFCLLIGLVFLFGSYKMYTSDTPVLTDKNVITITGVISNEVKVLQTYGRGGGKTWVSLKLKEYPDFLFDISDKYHKIINAMFLAICLVYS